MLSGICRSFFRNSFGLKTSKHISSPPFVKDPFIYGCAVLAKSVINKLRKQSNLENLKKQSKTQEIIDCIDKHENVCQQSKNEIKALFTTGINIKEHQFVFSQSRIKKGRINLKQAKREQKDKVFVFHPSNLVTGQIFRQLYKSSSSKIILSGHKGISKTVSTFLFWKLTKYIDAYRFMDGEKVDDEFYDIPKMVYWTIKQENTLQQVRENILQQCPQVKNLVTLSRLFEINQLSLKYYYGRYSKRLRLCIVIDQINLIASLFRQYLSKNGLLDLKFEQLRHHQITDPVLAKFKVMLHKILPSFHGIINLSSMSIEQIFSEIFNLSTQGKHSLASMESVQYPSQIYNEESMYELTDHFLFQYEQRCLRSNGIQVFDHEMKKKIRDQCVKYLEEKIHNYYFTPLNIREWIVKKTIKITKQYVTLTKEKKIEKVVSDFKIFVQKTTKQFKETINSGFLKRDANDFKRMSILFYIYNQLKQIVAKQKQLNDLKNKEQESAQSKKQRLSEISEAIQMKNCIWQSETEEFIDKTLFQFDGQNIHFLVPASLILQGIEKEISVMAKQYVKINKQLILPFKKQYLGKLTQYLFIKALFEGKVGLKFYPQTPDKNSQDKYILSIPKLAQNIYLFKSLEQITLPEKKSKQNADQSRKIMSKDKTDLPQKDEASAPQKSVATLDDKGPSNAQPLPLISQSQKRRLNRKRFIIRNLEENTKIRREKKFKFLQSLIPHIKRMIQNKQESALFLPTGQKKNQHQILKALPPLDNKILDTYSMVIDLIWVGITKDALKNKSITIVASDLTVGSKVYQKYEKFMQQFVGFEDRAQTKIIIGDNKKQIIPISMNYYVLGTQPYQGDLSKEFNQTFGKFMKFSPHQQNKFGCLVQELDGHKNSLLKSIGYLDLRNVVFENEVQKDALLFKQILAKAIQYNQDRKKQKQEEAQEKMNQEDNAKN